MTTGSDRGMCSGEDMMRGKVGADLTSPRRTGWQLIRGGAVEQRDESSGVRFARPDMSCEVQVS